MPLRDILIMLMVCFVWAANNIVSKLVISHLGVPPFAFATLRFGFVALAVSPWLRHLPRPVWRFVLASLTMGAANFGFLFLGFRTASPSAMAIVTQIAVPLSTLLSVIFLGERIRWRRILGICLTLAGALTVMWNPRALTFSTGLLFGAASAISFSIGAIMIKRMSGIKPLQFQAGLAAFSVPLLLLLSAVSEKNQLPLIRAGGWPLVGGVLFSALGSSLLSYTAYFSLLQRYEVNTVAPLTLLVPVATIGLGVAITHDSFDAYMVIGTIVTLIGVLIILLRSKPETPMTALSEERGS